MNTHGPLLAEGDSSFSGSTITVMVCLLLTAAIIVAGASLQLVQGAKGGDATADHIHRFMAGVYIGWAPMFVWAGLTIRDHDHGPLIYLLTAPIFLGFAGRMLSLALRGLPVRPSEFLSFAALEFVLGCVIVIAHALG
ncbi:DUF4345 family protein [Nocardia bhagyanarayanae]|uniref:Uncharacterized protein DUF4345 n=1 Tax=Nocardia bhagyanarayanae TaxID=1215925 RepID=A0A543FH23_9NOCA|nr:DUF4345 family protein [Nocardia bhagyanarayanae]TQM33072.1 uncharacterized protein DUF4345 [Nocardia bhagyanarayanae]